MGGGDLAAAFMRQDLIDEYRIYVHPIQIGEGKRLADELHNARAILRDHRAMGEAIWERFNSTEPAEVVGEIRVRHERGTQAGPA